MVAIVLANLASFGVGEVVNRLGDQTERRYKAGGHRLQTVHKHRFRVADHVGVACDETQIPTGP